ncbi:MAG: hypothetical protein GXP54_13800, partial [Deltaproteobacteria bacterium]|nr:hypothetical protein [Deltaproteobacteria bacterium]
MSSRKIGSKSLVFLIALAGCRTLTPIERPDASADQGNVTDAPTDFAVSEEARDPGTSADDGHVNDAIDAWDAKDLVGNDDGPSEQD